MLENGLSRFIYSFPVQLLIIHVKKNLSLVAIWVLFIALISGGIGKIYGVPYLFLDPEYLNEVNFSSFFIVGLAFGSLTMAFHITCYILDSHRFPFVGLLESPFAKFAVNNALLPLISLIIYLCMIVKFQVSNEFSSAPAIFFNVLGLVSGVSIMMWLYFTYFRFTNKDIFKFLTGSVDKRLRKSKLSRERMMNRLKETRKNEFKVVSYFDLKVRFRSCEGLTDFYDKKAVLKVFDQNHLNSVLANLSTILVILLLGTYMENPYFQIPAAASTLLMLSILVMVIGAITFWLKGWAIPISLLVFILVNVIMKIGILKGLYEVRGVDYWGEKAPYTVERLMEINTAEHYHEDSQAMLQMLGNWKSHQPDSLPKLMMLCVSGGGQRAALWTVNALQHADSILGRSLMSRVFMITGASGGMIGASYYREVVSMDSANRPGNAQQLQNIGKDNLNPIMFSLFVNDAFFRVRHAEFEGEKYVKDRGYIFEENLQRNLKGIFRKKLSDYAEDERQANVPFLLLSPVVANDGRKMYISTQPVSFMSVGTEGAQQDGNTKIWGVDFNRLFEKQGSQNLHFISALRMSASFPYITPTVTLPSKPGIEIMDAGISDNFGLSDAIRFTYVFEKWITENTSGVVFLIIRDTRKSAPIEAQSNPSLIDRVTYPISSVYNNLANIQDINNDIKLEALASDLEVPLETVSFEYNTYTNIDQVYLLESKNVDRKRLERASLSWHLTTREKQNIIHNIYLENNQEALVRLESLFQNP